MVIDKYMESIYEQLHLRSCPLIASNSLDIEPLPVEGEMRWGLSLVLRGQLPEPAVKVIDDVREILGSGHTFYSNDSCHITIRSLEPFHEKCNQSNIAVYKELVDKFSNKHKFNINFTGLSTTSSGLILRGYPCFDIKGMRESIHNELLSYGLVSNSPEPSIHHIRNTCHASLVIFGRGITSTSDYLRYLDTKQSAALGTAHNWSLELVRFIRSSHNVEVVAID